MLKFYIGRSVVYGSLIIKPSLLIECAKKQFYQEIAQNLEENNLQKHKIVANSLFHLKQGITIGKYYFIITETK